MTTILIICTASALMFGAILWCALAYSADVERACADYEWHLCSWCQYKGETTWFNSSSGVMRATMPRNAPKEISHGMCPDCHRDFLSRSSKDSGRPASRGSQKAHAPELVKSHGDREGKQ